jgi:hypothetical protein
MGRQNKFKYSEELDAMVAAQDLDAVEAWIKKHVDQIHELRAEAESKKSRKAAMKALREIRK